MPPPKSSSSTADSFLIKTTNAYHYVDYKKQIIPIKNDMRTTYDFGHRNQILNDRIGPPAVSVPDVCAVLATRSMPADYDTETRRQFYAKAPSTFDQKAERAMSGRKAQFVQTQEERIFRRPPKSIAWARTQYQRDYTVPLVQYEERAVPRCHAQPPVPRSQQVIYAHLPGHQKYLDPYATTNQLGHPQHSVDQQNGIGRKDFVTLWDWFEYPKGKGFGLQFYPVKQKGAKQPVQDEMRFKLKVHDRLIPNERLPVPNNGMRSEQRAEYGIPIPFSYDSDVYAIQPLPMPYIPLVSNRPESTMYASAKRIDELIDQNGPETRREAIGG